MPERDTSLPNVFKKFRTLLTSPELVFLMEAHNGLSARIVEETGFDGIWASGLSMSAAFGVRDRGEASWTQILDVLEFMSDSVSIPIMVDADTGFGDFNVFRRVVKKLCQRSIAAVCIEDQSFPKTNSLIEAGQRLADVDEFCGKIKSGKDSQTNADFSIVARLEALIAGKGMDEALSRAAAYHAAGADGILIHSRKTVAEEVLTFIKEWAGRCPVIIVPTMYHRTPTPIFREAGVSIMIWANHNLRASISAMREVSSRIKAEQSISSVEDSIAGLAEVFDLTDNKELTQADRRYLPRSHRAVKAIVLAATRGSPLGEMTKDKPKCMLDVRGEPILKRLVRILNGHDVNDITVVCGYKADAVNLASIRTVLNADYEQTGELVSLYAAKDALSDECIIAYGDIVFREHLIRQLLMTHGDVVLLVDSTKIVQNSEVTDWVACSEKSCPDHLIYDQPVDLLRMSADIPSDERCGQWVGLARFGAKATALVSEVFAHEAFLELYRHAAMADLFALLVERGLSVKVVYTAGDWLDVNDAFGLADARNFL